MRTMTPGWRHVRLQLLDSRVRPRALAGIRTPSLIVLIALSLGLWLGLILGALYASI